MPTDHFGVTKKKQGVPQSIKSIKGSKMEPRLLSISFKNQQYLNLGLKMGTFQTPCHMLVKLGLVQLNLGQVFISKFE